MMISYLRPLLLTVILCASALASATGTLTLSAANEIYRAAHTAYQKQDFLDARAKYLQVVESGFRSQDLFYNLGTTAARLGRRGEAILYLEKARELGPRSQDVLVNLGKVAPVDNPLTGSSPSEPVRWITGSMSLTGWALTFLAVFLVACLLGALRLARPGRPASPLLRLGIFTFALATLAVGALAWLKYYQQEIVQNAVVMIPAATLRSGPAEKFTQIETLPEGTIVRRLKPAADGWTQVQLGNNRQGYLPTPELENI